MYRLAIGIFGIVVLSLWAISLAIPDDFSSFQRIPYIEQISFLGVVAFAISWGIGVFTFVRAAGRRRVELFLLLGLAVAIAAVLAWHIGFDKVQLRFVVIGALSIAGGLWSCAYSVRPNKFTLRLS